MAGGVGGEFFSAWKGRTSRAFYFGLAPDEYADVQNFMCRKRLVRSFSRRRPEKSGAS